MSVRWAFIGAGRHAELWIAPAIERAANAVAVGAWSRQRENAEAFAGRHDIGRVYGSLDEAVADPEVDAVFISTPNSFHAAHSIAALEAGKHVLVEKPMAVSLDEAQAMVAAARAADRQLGIGFHFRHNELIQDAQRRIAAGEIGDVQYARVQFNLVTSPPPRMEIPHAPWKRDPEQIGGAAALMGMGVHVLDLLRFLVGREIVSVSAFAVGVAPGQPLESFASVLLEFDGGAQGHVAYGGRFPLSQNDAVVYGSGGRVVAENVIDVVTGGTLHVSIPEGRTGARTASRRPEPVDHYQRQIEAFSRAVAEGVPFHASGEDGLRSVEVQMAVIESQRTGGRVAVQRTDG
jgi:1,5-anhydro-D-fructose reductase (1,5-anhydro-D-mannitol-forming)